MMSNLMPFPEMPQMYIPYLRSNGVYYPKKHPKQTYAAQNWAAKKRRKRK
jgi:hypothetical protein